jgi:hypothetical protein
MAHWFKFWTSAREDSKLRSLTDMEFRYWMLLLCLGAEDGGAVDMGDPEMVCIEIGLTDDDGEPLTGTLETIVKKLERRRLVTLTDDRLGFNGWAYRQMKPSDRPEAVKERVAKHRKHKCNADVTRYVTPTEAEADIEAEAERSFAREVRSNFPQCFAEEIERDGATCSFRGHLLRDLEQYTGTWPSIPKNHGKLGAAIREGCTPDCNGEPVRRCVSALIRHARTLHEEFTAKGEPFPIELFLYKCREGAR